LSGVEMFSPAGCIAVLVRAICILRPRSRDTPEIRPSNAHVGPA
jgi:hypothetical protein